MCQGSGTGPDGAEGGIMCRRQSSCDNDTMTTHCLASVFACGSCGRVCSLDVKHHVQDTGSVIAVYLSVALCRDSTYCPIYGNRAPVWAIVMLAGKRGHSISHK